MVNPVSQTLFRYKDLVRYVYGKKGFFALRLKETKI